MNIVDGRLTSVRAPEMAGPGEAASKLQNILCVVHTLNPNPALTM